VPRSYPPKKASQRRETQPSNVSKDEGKNKADLRVSSATNAIGNGVGGEGRKGLPVCRTRGARPRGRFFGDSRLTCSQVIRIVVGRVPDPRLDRR
jgi:hypothetical protein